MKNHKWYVTTTDTFFTKLFTHKLRGRTNKLIFVCDSLEQAEIVAKNARARSDQRYVNIRSTFPYYNKARVYAQVKTINDYPDWYIYREYPKLTIYRRGKGRSH